MNKKLYKVNAVFLGEPGVGKTSIIKRLLKQGFDENVLPTINVSYHLIPKIKFINEEEDNSEIEIQIWDTLGQEKYCSLNKICVQRADIIIFVRDNKKFNFEFWFNFVENIIDIEAKKIIYCLNKTDLMEEIEKNRIYNELKALNIKKKHHAITLCVSSKNSDGILNLGTLLEEKSQEKVSNDLKRHNYTINIIIIGETNVGKSSLIERIINDSFSNDLSPTVLPDIRPIKVDLKNHSSINYHYCDTPGQEIFISTWNHYLDKVDIIIFVNNKDELHVNTRLIENRVLLSDKKVICCINKKDLFTDAESEEIIKKFKEENEKLKDKPIILVSAKTSDGIKELNNKINEYSIDIIDKKINENQNESVSTHFMLKNEKEKESCFNYLKNKLINFFNDNF